MFTRRELLMWRWTFVCALAACLASSTSCGSSDLQVAGRVLVDGQPMETGTIHFEPLDNGKGVGGSVESGAIALPSDEKMSPGRYRVKVQGFRRTGRMINDPERGSVPEMMPLVLRNSPQEIEISRDNANDLVIEFTTLNR